MIASDRCCLAGAAFTELKRAMATLNTRLEHDRKEVQAELRHMDLITRDQGAKVGTARQKDRLDRWNEKMKEKSFVGRYCGIWRERARRLLRIYFVAHILRILAMALSVTIVVCLLVAVSFGAPVSYEVLACFVFYSLATVVVWVPLRDTAGSVLFNARWSNRAMTAVLYATPCVAALILICGQSTLYVYGDHDQADASGRALVDTAVRTIAHLNLYILIPLILYALRHANASMMMRGVKATPRAEESVRRSRPKEAVALYEDTVHRPPRKAAASQSEDSRPWWQSNRPRRVQVAAAPSPGRPARTEVRPGTAPTAVPDVTAFDHDAADGEMLRPSGATTVEVMSFEDTTGTQGGGFVRPLLPGREMAAVRLQCRFRGKLAHQRLHRKLATRRKQLIAFSHPIFWATLVFVFGVEVFHNLRRGDQEYEGWVFWQLLCAVPSWLVVMYDLYKPISPKFSLTHCFFFTAVLYPLCFVLRDVDTSVFETFSELFLEHIDRNDDGLVSVLGVEIDLIQDIVPIIALVVHFAIYFLVTFTAQSSLLLVARPNSCSHVLFPLQFFDFISAYAFFSTRQGTQPLTISWVLMQVLLQANVFMRNAGAYYIVTNRGLKQLYRVLGHQDQFGMQDYDSDPLFVLQYLARMAVQYDLAQLVAIILTPSMITIFIIRDGFFTLQGSGILLRPCDLRNVWLRFGVLFCLTPFASYAGQLMLQRAMRKTLLGKRTMYGVSAIVTQRNHLRKVTALVATAKKNKKVAKGGGRAVANEMNEGGVGTAAPSLAVAEAVEDVADAEAEAEAEAKAEEDDDESSAESWSSTSSDEAEGAAPKPRVAALTSRRAALEQALLNHAAADVARKAIVSSREAAAKVTRKSDVRASKAASTTPEQAQAVAKSALTPGGELSVGKHKHHHHHHHHHHSRHQHQLTPDEEEFAHGDELNVSGLDYKALYMRIMRKRRFFFCVFLFQLFAAFPVSYHAPHGGDDCAATDDCFTAFDGMGKGGGEGSEGGGRGVMAATNVSLFILPRYNSWLYMSPRQAYQIDEPLRFAYARLYRFYDESTDCSEGHDCVYPSRCEIEDFPTPETAVADVYA